MARGKEVLNSLTTSYKAQAQKYKVDREKALEEQFFNGMRHEHRMCNLVHPALVDAIVHCTAKESEQWKSTSPPISHPNLGVCLPHRTVAKDMPNSHHSYLSISVTCNVIFINVFCFLHYFGLSSPFGDLSLFLF